MKVLKNDFALNNSFLFKKITYFIFQVNNTVTKKIISLLWKINDNKQQNNLGKKSCAWKNNKTPWQKLICRTRNYVHPLIDIQSSNPCPIVTSQIYVLFKFSNRRPILKSMAVSHFLKSTSNDVTDVCPNPNPNQ
jgi:hypothetical protein